MRKKYTSGIVTMISPIDLWHYFSLNPKNKIDQEYLREKRIEKETGYSKISEMEYAPCVDCIVSLPNTTSSTDGTEKRGTKIKIVSGYARSVMPRFTQECSKCKEKFQTPKTKKPMTQCPTCRRKVYFQRRYLIEKMTAKEYSLLHP